MLILEIQSFKLAVNSGIQNWGGDYYQIHFIIMSKLGSGKTILGMILVWGAP